MCISWLVRDRMEMNAVGRGRTHLNLILLFNFSFKERFSSVTLIFNIHPLLDLKKLQPSGLELSFYLALNSQHT